MLRDKRLKLLAELTPVCDTAADIGTDHGLLGCALIEQRKAKNVWFTDISEESLSKARSLVMRKGLEERARFFTGDGAELLPYAPEAAVISGMGGHTIIHILSNAGKKLQGTKLVLGANTALKELRRWLMENDYVITDEAAVREAEQFYVVICAENGRTEFDETDLFAGPVLRYKADDETKEYFRYRFKGAQIAYDRASVSKTADIETLRKEVELWKKLS